MEKLVQASTASLHSLLQSGAQEASEEGGIKEILLPNDILAEVHHFKTGVLFQCTWAIPKIFEETISPAALSAQESLYNIGMGCQILDDMVDLFLDLGEKRHNYVASVIFHQEKPHVWQDLKERLVTTQSSEDFFADHPKIAAKLRAKALSFLGSGMNSLFFDHHQYLVQPAMNFVAERIGIKLHQDE
jgi:geranylgeranyl pyrophosphate synthase